MKSKIIFFVFLFAFLIRLIALNQSLWLDEAVTANVVKNLGFFQIITKFSPNDFHPPLYYLFMKLWTNIFGYSEIALRMPSIIFSLVTGYVIYKMTKWLYGYMAGIWGAIFFLFNPLIIYYSQEARMYMMTTFFLVTALYYFEKMLQIQKSKLKSQKLDVLFFGVFISLAFLAFYGSIFLIISMFLYLLYKKEYRFLIVSLLMFIASLLIISPLLYQQIINSKVVLANVANWSLVLGKANIKNLLLIPIKFSIGRISFEPKWLYWGIAGIWTTFVWLIIIQKSKACLRKQVKSQNLNSKVKSLQFLFIFPLLLSFMVSFFVPMLQYFRFIYLIPIMAILLARKIPTVYCYTVGIGFIIFSSVYLLFPQFHREDWKNLVKLLPRNKSVYMISSSSDPLKYYKNNLIIKELASLRVSELEKEISVIPYTADIYGLDYKKILGEKNYRLADKKTFQGLELEFFILNN